MAVGTLTPTPARPAPPRSFSPWRCSVEDYERMYDTGILDPDQRTELLDGRIYVVPPPGPVHCSIVDRLNRLFCLGLTDRAVVRVQSQVPVSNWSAPAPDLALLAARDDFYENEHPRTDQCLLFVEVAQSSLRTDRDVKAPLYARAGIAEYWIVDVQRRQILVHRNPTGASYATMSLMGEADTVSPAAFPDLQLSVAEILGRPRAR